jgi:two-component system LytT family response regulator
VSGFRVLVVDDEPLAREIVVNLLSGDAEIDRVTDTGESRAVPRIVSEERPDILFLDVEMPGLDGIGIASGLKGDLPVVVYVTAYSDYALDAFEVEAADYLLKPFTDDRFFGALERAKRRVRERRMWPAPGSAAPADERSGAGGAGQPWLERVAVGHGDETRWIDLADVVLIQAEDYYVLLHVRHQGRHLLRASMQSLEERLDPRCFVRVHRGAIVNLADVVRLQSDPAALVLADGTLVPISRARRAHVERVVGTRQAREWPGRRDA